MRGIVTKPRITLLAVCVVSFVAGFFTFYLYEEGGPHSIGELRDSGKYKYISPLLACSEAPALLPREVKETEDEVRAIIDTSIRSGVVSEAAVYFRDLTNGPWFGINEDTTFVPGSLLKVPMMMAYLSQYEKDPSIAAKDIVYDHRLSNAVQNVAVAHPLVIGERYQPDALLEKMITESDNESAYLLYSLVDQAEVEKVYTELGLEAPFAGSDYDIRVRDYSTFFRILYNATYLSPESSERALTLLTQADFDEGIAAGVPENIAIANKFGERDYTGTELVQFHDCGIVYAPQRPYVLCVMTRGKDIQSLEKVVQNISKAVYTNIGSN